MNLKLGEGIIGNRSAESLEDKHWWGPSKCNWEKGKSEAQTPGILFYWQVVSLRRDLPPALLGGNLILGDNWMNLMVSDSYYSLIFYALRNILNIIWFLQRYKLKVEDGKNVGSKLSAGLSLGFV